MCDVIDAQNIIRSTRRSDVLALVEGRFGKDAQGSVLFDLPHEVPLVGHGADGIHGATACLEFEVAVRFAALAS